MPHKLVCDWCIFVLCERLMLSIHCCTKGVCSGELMSVRFHISPNEMFDVVWDSALEFL
jgi:hypothetical protein